MRDTRVYTVRKSFSLLEAWDCHTYEYCARFSMLPNRTRHEYLSDAAVPALHLLNLTAGILSSEKMLFPVELQEIDSLYLLVLFEKHTIILSHTALLILLEDFLSTL